VKRVKIKPALTWQLQLDDTVIDLESIVTLLANVQQDGNLRAAARRCGYSYRKAWDSIKQMEKILGADLVVMQRGKGSQLSPLGLKLLEIEQQNKQCFNDSLLAAANNAQQALQDFLPRQTVIVASDSELLNTLRSQQLPVTIKTQGSLQALQAFSEGKCDMAGFHLNENISKEQLKLLLQHLNPHQDQFILLEQRQQGLMSNPLKPVNSLQQAIEEKLQFVNRQQGSGTRLLLDRLLDKLLLKAEQLPGYYHEEHTHLAVASLIASKQADVGLGIESVAKQLGLHFVAITREYYFLVFKQMTFEMESLISCLGGHYLNQIMDYKSFIKTLTNKDR